MLKEFKEFAVKGNVIDMAVGIIIGASFTTVVKSVVDDIIMPPIGVVTGGLDFSDKFIVLRDPNGGVYHTVAEAKAAGASVLSYGLFINAVVAFLIVAWVLFFIVRWTNNLRRKDAPAAPSTKKCQFCQSQIDLAATRCPQCTSQLGVE